MKAIGCSPSGIGTMSKASICGGGGTGKSPEVSRVRGDSKVTGVTKFGNHSSECFKEGGDA